MPSLPDTGPAGPQLPLALRTGPDQRFDAYVDAPAGLLEQLQATASGAADDWLYLVGAVGTGKTHLLLQAAAGRLRDALVALEGNALIALDGLEHIAGDRDDEVALFDAHNRLRTAGTTLLYAAVDAPDALAIGLPDLRSRLSQCARLVLPPLDEAGRREVLRRRAERRGLVIEDAALDWLLRRVGRDLGGLTALLDRLDRASLAAKRRVTVPFLRALLAAE
jgi:DnaA-homolog protein